MKKRKEKHCFFTGGGTLGHVIPALALLEHYYQNRPLRLHWIGSYLGPEKAYLKKYSYIQYHSIPSGKWRRYFSFLNIRDLFLILGGFLWSMGYIFRYRPQFVFSKGGFVSTPLVWAAAIGRIPVFSYESDLSPGLATRLNFPFSRYLFTTYPQTENFFSSSHKIRWVGFCPRHLNKTKLSFSLEKFFNDNQNKPCVLVWGGSLGAQEINTLIENNLSPILSFSSVIHQYGAHNQEAIRSLIARLSSEEKKSYYAQDFFDEDLAHILDRADVVISRAGTNSLFELAYANKIALIIPLRRYSRQDQVENAQYFTQKKAMRLWDNQDKTLNFIEEIRSLLFDTEQRQKMQTQLKTIIHNKEAVSLMFHTIEKLLSP